MKIPKNHTEKETLDIIVDVANKFKYKFRFGYHNEEDIAQVAIMFGIEGLENYDGLRPLPNFICTHIRNRLINYKRDNYLRHEKPCTTCPFKAFLPPDGCSKYKDLMFCSLYSGWVERNIKKRNITYTIDFDQIKHDERNMKYDCEPVDNINKKEIMDLIDTELPVRLRKYYLMMLNGDNIPKKYKEQIKKAVLEIAERNNFEY